MFKRTLSALIGLLVLAGFWAPVPASAQSVDAVISQMKQKYEQQLAAVDNYIIETDKYTTYHRKVTKDGTATYESTTQWTESEGMMGGFTMDDAGFTQPGEGDLDRFAQNARYAGTETIDGVRTHVLIVDDPSALDDEMPTQDEMEGNVEVGALTFYVHADEYVPVRVEYDATFTHEDGESQQMTAVMTFRNYRTVDGLTIPYNTTMQMDNLNASISPEDREEARKGLEEMEKQMAQMDEQQRKMMERMMSGQLDKLRKIIEEGTIEYAIEVQDVQVNSGIPDGVFSSNN